VRKKTKNFVLQAVGFLLLLVVAVVLMGWRFGVWEAWRPI
jgi:hypothetical protein